MVGTQIGFQGEGTARPIVALKYHGELMVLSICVGSNGFVVSLNIASRELFDDSGLDEADLNEWP